MYDGAVENLAYEKDSYVNSRRQYKRHTARRHHDTPRGSTDNAVDHSHRDKSAAARDVNTS